MGLFGNLFGGGNKAETPREDLEAEKRKQENAKAVKEKEARLEEMGMAEDQGAILENISEGAKPEENQESSQDDEMKEAA